MRIVLALLLTLCSAVAAMAAQTLTDPDHTYRLVVDDGWTTMSTHAPHTLIVTSTSHPGTQVTIRSMQGAADGGWVTRFRREMERQMPSGKWQPSRDVTVAGMPAVRMDVVQSGCPMSFIVVGAPDRSWLISVVSTNPAGYDKLLSSFLTGMKIP